MSNLASALMGRRDYAGAERSWLAHSRAVIAALFGPGRARSFSVRYWTGDVDPAGYANARFTLVINHPGALRAMLLPPSELSLVEAYLTGAVDVEGELEAAATLDEAVKARLKSPATLARVTRHLLALPRGDGREEVRRARAARSVQRTGRRHEKSRDRSAIQYHYDVGNDFYALWLDSRMVYSCAYFETPEQSLDDAQLAKLDLVCRKLRLRPGERLLDVGCGWGALVLHAARCYGVTALGITLSEAQLAFARERIAAEHAGDCVRVELRDYRDLPADETFDKIASVGMVEHVGIDNLPVYFASLHRALRPGGLLLNHGIVSVDAARPIGWRERLLRRLWRSDAFIDQYVFPDGKLGPLHAVIGAAEAVGFETRDVQSLREHYALTLRAWLRRLAERKAAVIAATNERTFRTWRLYMSASAQGFASGRLNVVQTLFTKPTNEGESALPLRREI